MGTTIKDVAAAAGVSTATVSKVINNNPSISDETIAKVKDVMRELNYVPNRRAQNFAKQSTGIVLMAINFHRNIAFENPHIFEIMVGLQKTLAAQGYVLNIINVNKNNCMDVLGDIIAQKSVDGIVAHISVVSRELEKIILKKSFPHIVIGCPEYKTRLCWIDNNNVLSGEIATEYLYKRGYRKIAYLGGSRSDVGSENRLSGVRNFLESRMYKLPKEYIYYGESTIESGRDGIRKMLELQDPPEAVVCANNNMALGAYFELKDRSVSIPEDIGIITFDVFPYTKITNPRITTVDIDVYDMGKLAGDMIIRKIKKPNFEIQSFTMLANLVVNGSTK